MDYPNLELCGIPWKIEKDRKNVQSYLKRIRRAQLKLTQKQDQLIGLDWVPIIRSKRLSCFKNSPEWRTEFKRQQRLLKALAWTKKMIKNERLIKPKHIFEIHAILMGKEKSSYRKQTIYLKDLKGKKLVDFPEAKNLPHLMKEFWAWNQQMSHHPALLKAIGAHFLLANIHPFIDGNGRLARLFEFYQLARHSPKNLSLYSSELICHWSFTDYSNSLLESAATNSMNPFIEFCLLQHVLFLDDLVHQN